MPELHEQQKARSLGFTGRAWYMWSPCTRCGKYRWVRLLGKSPYRLSSQLCKCCVGKHEGQDIKASRAKAYRRWCERHPHRTRGTKYILSRGISRDIRKSIYNKGRRHWETLVGYTVKDLIKHLQRQFKKDMTWGNYGKWHIDHVIPQSAFHYTTPDDIDFRRCWALSNLQPLWSEDNVAKSDKILKPFQPSLKLENKNTKGT